MSETHTPIDEAPESGSAATDSPGSQITPAWREYELLIDLYKFYLGLVVQASGGYFVIVGGILTLVLANVKTQPIIAGALVVPILLSLLLAIATGLARRQVRELMVATCELGNNLDVSLPPHVQVLEWAVTWSSRLLTIAAVLLLLLLIRLLTSG